VDAYKKAFNDVVFKEGTFKIRAKQETYNDETRLRCSIVSYHPINYVEASNHLIEFIEQYRK
jgi:replication factor A1